MEEIIVIKPGHYCTKDTIDSETKSIIKIIGPAQSEGYWLTDDGRILNEYLIHSDYEPLYTSWNNSTPKQQNFLKGFKPTVQEESEMSLETSPILKQTAFEEPLSEVQKSPMNRGETKENQTSFNNQTKAVQNPIETKEIDKCSEVRFLLSKTHIDTLNKSSQEKFGESNYKPVTISIPVEVEIPYDLSKLNVVCNLFDLDIRKVAEMIYSDIMFPEHIIVDKIMDALRPDESKEPASRTQRSTPAVFEIVEHKQPDVEVLQESIDVESPVKYVADWFETVEIS